MFARAVPVPAAGLAMVRRKSACSAAWADNGGGTVAVRQAALDAGRKNNGCAHAAAGRTDAAEHGVFAVREYRVRERTRLITNQCREALYSAHVPHGRRRWTIWLIRRSIRPRRFAPCLAMSDFCGGWP